MPRQFHLQRDEDASGVSGTGTVAEGIEFSPGLVALLWLPHYWSVAIYPNIKQVERIHGHDGKTRVVWDD